MSNTLDSTESRKICDAATGGKWGSTKDSDHGVWVDLEEPKPGITSRSEAGKAAQESSE